LSNNLLITSKYEIDSDLNRKDYHVLYLEDYYSISSASDARRLTEEIFKRNDNFIQEHDYKGYKITWSWYNDVYDLCLKYLEIKKLVEALELLEFNELTIGEISPHYRKILILYFLNKKIIFKEKSSLYSSIKLLINNFLMLTYSAISILFLFISKKRYTATYTGDFVYSNTTSDFRYKNLYDKYEENNINLIEFIRETSISNFFKNIYKRKRLSIYFKSITFFVNLFTKRKKYHQQPKDFYESIIYRFHDSNLVLKKSIFIFEKILKIIRIDKVVLIFFASRNAEIAIAAKSLGIKTIGIMHGSQQKEYDVYEFMEGYQENKKLGCDVYGVWSPYYLEYFKKYSRIMNLDNICYSGRLRPMKNFDSSTLFTTISEDKIKVLLISEPLVSVNEIIPYLRSLLNHKDIEVAIKIRPMIKDIFYEELLVEFPSSKNLQTYNGKIEDAGKNFDVLIGSHSTAVVEASLFWKISVLLHTVKFGDYFEIDNLLSDQLLLVRDPELLYENIVYRVKNEHSLKTINLIRKRFFGDNKDGAQWIIDQL
jgi:hypothetical protein